MGSHLRKTLRIIPFLFLLSFATERPACAYTDPGSGVLVWQMLVAGFVGVAFYFRRLTSWFKGKKGPKE
jgi:hypothetical protein